jgi:peptidoglycan hydrolase CwlO-like protein
VPKKWLYIICAVLAFWSIASVFIIFRGSDSKLSAELSTARESLGRATQSNVELAGELRQLRTELDQSNKLSSDQQRIIAENKRRLDDQQRIIDGIAETIRNQGGDIRGQIKAIADGFRRLYAFYHPGAR